ncbi:hypothetical protein KM043_015726 [Ampulex compressa]|nr:hypothetical protein KM043_015726 [Ampulex compressa]
MELPSLAKENSAGLRQILDGALKHTRGLKAMGRPVGYWDDCLVHIVAGKLDPITYKEWEGTLSQSSLPSFSQLTEFLSHRCEVLEAVLHKSALSAFSSLKTSLQRQKTVSHLVTGPVSCQICQDSHYIHQCDTSRSIPVHQRIKEVRGLGLCLNCLRSTVHYAQACNSIGCRKCQKKHNTLLHIEAKPVAQLSSPPVAESKGFAERLNLKLRRHDTPVTGINQAMALAHHSVSIKFKLLLKGITQNLPLISIPKGAYQIPGGIKLADPNFSQSSGIDILLGTEIFFEVLCVGQIKAGVSHPCLQKSHLGWIVSGSVRKEYTQNQAVSCNLATQDLSMMLAKFWELDQCLGNTAHTKEEAECEALFMGSYKRDEQHQSQTSLQRILWRENTDENVRAYELLTVTYGTAPASFLATRCLQEMAELEKALLPLGATVVKRDFYVDDLLTGANSIGEAIVIRDQVIKILSKTRHKWSSNSSRLLEDIPCQQAHSSILSLNKDDDVAVLGTQWNTVGDVLQYSIPARTVDRVTKRTILASVARVFDPLGLIGPVLLSAKIVIQRLWQLGIGWDESVPIELHTRWLRYESQLPELNNLKVPRHVMEENPIRVDLHGFSDASEEAYGACVYEVSIDKNEYHRGQLLCAKSRVAPLRNVSLPRLELCGALLLAKLAEKFISILDVQFENIYCWTDSSIVLAWIKSSSRNWNTFVANRIGEIQDLVPFAQWGHVPTKENPADIISKGATPTKLMSQVLWWEGPTALFNRDQGIHKRIVCVSLAMRLEVWATAITSPEVARSKLCLVRLCQAYAFQDLERVLRKQRPHCKVPLPHLSPFLDDDGIIRVGGRLRNARSVYTSKCPILLPKIHPLTELIINQEHKRNLHAGCQGILAVVWASYWPLAGRDSIKRVLRKCVVCFRNAPVSSQYLMGDLPAYRVTPSRPFARTGVDYCGPFCVKEGRRRNAKVSKAYAAIFICMCTKAIHIELVADMTTESFLGCLKRFMSRRRKPAHIYSDNGSNFVGANRELRELTAAVFSRDGQERVANFLNVEGVDWHFIPPRAPHFGGLWEAAVKSAKHHVRRVAGGASLRFEELYTLLVQIEAVLNAKSLTPLSSDPSDLNVLTPAHFLIGGSMTTTVEPDLTDTPINWLSRWQHLEQQKQHFWRRWSKEYLHHLMQRPKWTITSTRPLRSGDMVIVREDNLPPLQWLLGREEKTVPRADGEVRAATIRTSRGIISRPTVKLCLLPIAS